MKNVLGTVMFAFVMCATRPLCFPVIEGASSVVIEITEDAGVFSADEGEVKSVMEGESITLNHDITRIQGINDITWRFQKKGSTTAENIQYVEMLKDRWKVDHQTASLTINNMRTKHSGLYILQIDHNTGTRDIRFAVTVSEVPSAFEAHKADTKSLSVKKEESFILETDVTTLHGDELIVWRFGDEGKLLVKVDKETRSPPYYASDERFRDRLKLNDQTGSLTIKHMTYTDAGLYTVKISSNKQTTYRKFTVAATGLIGSGLSSAAVAGSIIGLLLVFAAVTGLCFLYHRRRISELQKHLKLVQQGESVTLEPDTEIERDDEVQWMFGDKNDLIAKMGKMTGETREITYPDKRFRDRLYLDEETGSLTIKNTTIKDSGDFKVKISSSRRITETKIFSIMINVETKYVQHGEPVLLEPDTEMERDDEIQWTFGDKDVLIAKMGKMTGETREITYPDEKFRDRLQLDEETGSLIIHYITNEHTGDFKFKISNRRITETKIFCIKIKVETKSVQQGESVTIDPYTEIERDDEVQWRFGDKNVLIAKMGKMTEETREITYPDERFRGRLQLDEETGSLIIKNTTIKHSGDFKVKISSRRRITETKFCIKIKEETKYVEGGESVTLEPGTEIESDDEVQWTFGDKNVLIAKMGKMTGETRKRKYHVERFRGRLLLDEETGSLTIQNITIKHTGDFKVKISSSRRTNETKKFCIKIKEEKVRVVKGDTAVLNTAAEMQRDEDVEWRFNTDESPIAEVKDGEISTSEFHDGVFKGTLDLDKETGSLTIKNITHEHAGDYYLKVTNSRSGAHEKRFTVAVIDENETGQIFPFPGPELLLERRCIGRVLKEETGFSTTKNIRREHDGFYELKTMNRSSAGYVKTFHICVNEDIVTFTEGGTAVLESAAEIQNHDQIEWRFNYENLIAEIKDGQIFPFDGPEGIFKNRLELDEQTGFLTIKNIRREHAGIYQLKIMNSSSAVSVKTLTVFVNEEKVRVMKGRRAVLESAAEIQTDDHVEWRFEYKRSPIAEIRDGEISTSDGPGGRFRDTLDLDKKTGSLTIRNVRPEHAGFYLLKVKKSSSAVREKRLTVPFVVSKRKQVKNSAIKETPLLHEETPLLHEETPLLHDVLAVVNENEETSSV